MPNIQVPQVVWTVHPAGVVDGFAHCLLRAQPFVANDSNNPFRGDDNPLHRIIADGKRFRLRLEGGPEVPLIPLRDWTSPSRWDSVKKAWSSFVIDDVATKAVNAQEATYRRIPEDRVATRLWRPNVADLSSDEVASPSVVTQFVPKGSDENAQSVLSLLSRTVPSKPSNSALSDSSTKNYGFHESIGFVLEHPELAKELGLIFEAKFDVGGLPGAFAASVVPDSNASVAQLCLATACVLTSKGFFPKIDVGIITAQGTLTEDPGAVEVTPLDHIAIAHLSTAPAKPLGDVAAQEGMPTVRSDGLAYFFKRGEELLQVQRDRARERDGTIKSIPLALNAVQTVPSAVVQLRAIDLLVGGRVDVWNSRTKVWRSLMRRSVTYVPATRSGASTFGPFVDEGHVRPQATTEFDGSSGGDFRVVPTELFRYTGRQMAVEYPDASLDNGGGNRSEDSSRHRAESRLVSGYKVPYPILGVAYGFRLRACDRAGADLFEAVGSSSEALPTFTTVMDRFDPIPPPWFTQEKPISSFPDESDGFELFVSEPFQGAPPSRGRLVVLPPAATFDLIVRHGKLLGKSASEAWPVLTRLDADLSSPLSLSGDVAYLPDPGSAGIRISNMKVRKYAGTWPNLRPLSIRIGRKAAPMDRESSLKPAKGQKLPSWMKAEIRVNGDETTTDPVVLVPPGTRFRMPIRSEPIENYPDRDLHVRLLGSNTKREDPRYRIEAMDLTTPATLVDVVHAVRTPLYKPRDLILVESPGVQGGPRFVREIAASQARYETTFYVHVGSTGRCDVVAMSFGRTDDGTVTGKEETLPTNVVGDLSAVVDSSSNESVYGEVLKPQRLTVLHDPGSTKRLRVELRARAHSAFSNRYAAKDCVPAVQQHPLIVEYPATRRPESLNVRLVLPLFRYEPQPNGSLRRTAGLRVWVDNRWFSSGEGEVPALVLAPREAPFDGLSNVSQWANDPFVLNKVAFGLDLDAKRFDPSNPVEASLRHTEDRLQRATVRLLDLKRDDRRKMYFFDVDLAVDPYEGANPHDYFVRLALARYQPVVVHPDLHLSDIVTTDFVPMPPERTMNVVNVEGNWYVTLYGDAPMENEVRLELGERRAGASTIVAVHRNPASWSRQEADGPRRWAFVVSKEEVEGFVEPFVLLIERERIVSSESDPERFEWRTVSTFEAKLV